MIGIESRLAEKSVAIFLFHGVIERNQYKIRNYNRKHLEKEYFAGIVKVLAGKGVPLSMDDVVNHIAHGELFPDRSFVITFDDGFENNYSVAAPILADANIPATIYITTDFVDRNSMSWIDRIEHCFERVAGGALNLPWRSDVYFSEEYQSKRNVLDDIRRHVKSDASIDVDALVEAILNQCGVDSIFPSNDPLDKKMSWEQVRHLASDPGFIIGGHTHTHPIMSFLTSDALNFEIDTSINLLNNNTGIKVRHYSYPEGLAHCYSPDVIYALQSRGIECSPTAIDGLNDDKSSLFELRRILVA